MGLKIWLKNNYKFIVCSLVGLLVGVLIMLIIWPDRIAKLKDGSEPVITYAGKTLTADELYSSLKENYGVNKLLDIIDKDILDKEYDLDKEAEEYAKTTSENYYSQYESYYGYTKEQFLSSNGFESEKVFLDYLKFDFLCNTWYEDYLKSIITDKEINDFYKNEAFGEKKVTIYSSTKEKNDLESIRKSLKDGKKVKEYDSVTVNEVTIGSPDIDTYSKVIIKSLKGLKKGDYSKVIEDETYGHVVLYVNDSKDLGKLEDEKENIVKALSARMTNNDSGLYYKAFDVLRKKYNITFKDTKLEKAYNDYLKQYVK